MTNKEIYHEYLKSDEWSHLRQLATLRNKRKNNGYLTCVDCGLTHQKQYDVHHEQYPESQDYYNDDNSSFHVVLCRPCHEKRHNINGDDLIVEEKYDEYSFLVIHAAFLAINPIYMKMYMNNITPDIFEKKEKFFDLVLNHAKNNDSIEDLIRKVKHEKLNKEDIIDFELHLNFFNKTKIEKDALIKEIDKAVTITADSLRNMVNNLNREKAIKSIEELEKEQSVMFDNIIENIDKKIKKLDRKRATNKE